MSKPKLPADFIKLCKGVTAKRPKTVIDHVLKHGFITTEELKEKYGYNHPPRAVAFLQHDVRVSRLVRSEPAGVSRFQARRKMTRREFHPLQAKKIARAFNEGFASAFVGERAVILMGFPAVPQYRDRVSLKSPRKRARNWLHARCETVVLQSLRGGARLSPASKLWSIHSSTTCALIARPSGSAPFRRRNARTASSGSPGRPSNGSATWSNCAS